MLAGHFGLAAAVKAQEPRVPLWALILSTQLLDILFLPLVLLNVESLTRLPNTPSYGGSIIHANYTHSLLGALILALLAGAGATAVWDRRRGAIVSLVVFSHWILDLLVHRPDLPILPGNAGGLPLLGFGLWRAPIASALIESALVIGGTVLYFRAARRRAALPDAPPPSGRRQR
jgi:membrane-bound metal-dependent hydrolase YbcI (DUF457 family)